MNIEGWYKDRGNAPLAPFVRAVVKLPRLNIWGNVDFLLDSGADSCSLHPYDIRSLGLDRSTLEPPSVTGRGIGGELQYHIEEAELYFVGGNDRTLWRCDEFRICAEITDPAVADAVEGIPSPLGRNFQNLGLTVANPDKGQYAILPYWINGYEILSREPPAIPRRQR